MNFNLADAMCETLKRHADPYRRLVQQNLDPAEFNDLYLKIAGKIPGVSLPFQKLLADDPIESDPLVAQGTLAILRLDDLYGQAYDAWRKSLSGEVNFHKRTVTPGRIEDYSITKEKNETASKTTPPDTAILNQAVSITLAAFRIQATLTHRREKLRNQSLPANPTPVSPTRKRGTPLNHAASPSPAVSPPPVSPTRKRGTSSSSYHPDDLIDANESLEAHERSDSPYRVLQRIPVLGPLSGYGPIQADSSTSLASATPAETGDFVLASGNTREPHSREPHTSEPPISEPTHPQYTPPGAKWDYFVPPDLDLDDPDALKKSERPAQYYKPPFPNEKIHKFPPYAPASDEDAQEIDAYLRSLPLELQTTGKEGPMNEILAAPVWRVGQTELEHHLTHLRLEREKSSGKISLSTVQNELPLNSKNNSQSAPGELPQLNSVNAQDSIGNSPQPRDKKPWGAAATTPLSNSVAAKRNGVAHHFDQPQPSPPNSDKPKKQIPPEVLALSPIFIPAPSYNPTPSQPAFHQRE